VAYVKRTGVEQERQDTACITLHLHINNHHHALSVPVVREPCHAVSNSGQRENV
jgi:hypothetical protein